MSLPGPDVKKGVMRKIRDMAQQVSDVNIRALDGNMFSRVVNINAFYLPDFPEEEEIKQESYMQEGEKIQQDSLHLGQHSTAPLNELPTVPASPFSRYTLTTSHWMEIESRFQQSIINHAGLVQGDEGVDEDESWITKLATRFSQTWYRMSYFVSCCRCVLMNQSTNSSKP